MFSFASFLDLPMIWAGLVAVAVLLYVILDGFDLGIGILFPFAPTDKCRDSMMNAIAPFWDGNETWLILGGGGLLAAFPKAFGALMPAFYLPLIVMLIALIFRGVAFEFRFKADTSKRLWDVSFHGGSLVATFAQGVILGTFVQGIDIEGMEFAGGSMDWLTPFSLTTGAALVFGYALLGATWTIKKTENATKTWAIRAAKYLMVVVLGFLGIVSIWMPLLSDEVAARWFTLPNFYYLLPIPLITAIIAYHLYDGLHRHRDLKPFLMTIALFLVAYAGIAISQYPYIIPQKMTVWQAAAPPESLSLMLVGGLVMLPIILFYVGYTYWLFRGKTTQNLGYGAPVDPREAGK